MKLKDVDVTLRIDREPLEEWTLPCRFCGQKLDITNAVNFDEVESTASRMKALAEWQRELQRLYGRVKAKDIKLDTFLKAVALHTLEHEKVFDAPDSTSNTLRLECPGCGKTHFIEAELRVDAPEIDWEPQPGDLAQLKTSPDILLQVARLSGYSSPQEYSAWMRGEDLHKLMGAVANFARVLDGINCSEAKELASALQDFSQALDTRLKQRAHEHVEAVRKIATEKIGKIR